MTDVIADEVKQLYLDKGALLQGHFILSSGLRSEWYMQSAKVLQYPDIASHLGQLLADKCREFNANVVLGPAMGGILVSYEVARTLKTRSVFMERQDGIFTLRRGFELQDHERILVVEDVITTGKSTKEVIDVLKDYPGEVVAAASLVDRSENGPDIDVPVVSLLKLDIPTFSKDNCPEHLKAIPAIKPGSRPGL